MTNEHPELELGDHPEGECVACDLWRELQARTVALVGEDAAELLFPALNTRGDLGEESYEDHTRLY